MRTRLNAMLSLSIPIIVICSFTCGVTGKPIKATDEASLLWQFDTDG